MRFPRAKQAGLRVLRLQAPAPVADLSFEPPAREAVAAVAAVAEVVEEDQDHPENLEDQPESHDSHSHASHDSPPKQDRHTLLGPKPRPFAWLMKISTDFGVYFMTSKVGN